MKNLLKSILLGLGVIFVLVLLFVAYLFIFDPLGIKPLFFGGASTYVPSKTTPEQSTATTSNTTTQKQFLSESQKATLAKYGINPASLPTTITATQEACFKTKLGVTRFDAIVAGDSPTAIEFFNAKSCL